MGLKKVIFNHGFRVKNSYCLNIPHYQTQQTQSLYGGLMELMYVVCITKRKCGEYGELFRMLFFGGKNVYLYISDTERIDLGMDSRKATAR